MFLQMLVGSGLIATTLLLEAIFVAAAIAGLSRFGPALNGKYRRSKQVAAIIATTMWLLLALSAAVWIWAAAFIALGQFSDVETAVYFAVVSFTTLGYGDVVIGEEWRLLSGFVATNGLMLFALTTAFMIEVVRRIFQEEGSRDG